MAIAKEGDRDADWLKVDKILIGPPQDIYCEKGNFNHNGNNS